MTASYDQSAFTFQSSWKNLDMGTLATTHLMSDDLIAKIQAVKNKRAQQFNDDWNELDSLKAQIKEYSVIYTPENTLSVLTFLTSEGKTLFARIANNLKQVFKMDVCHVFLADSHNTGNYELAGSNYTLPSEMLNTYFNSIYGKQLLNTIRDTSDVTSYTRATIKTWEASEETPVFYNISLQYAIILPLYNAKGLYGFVLLGAVDSEKSLNHKQLELARATRTLLTDSLNLQQTLSRYNTELPSDENKLRQYRNQLSESVANLNMNQQWLVNALCTAIDASSHYTDGHSKGVAKLVKAMSEALGLNEKTIDLLHQAALVSVIGKLAIAYRSNEHKFPLFFNSQQKKEYNQLTANAADFLRQMNFASDVIPYIEYQQAQWDGEGLPLNLSGLSIPLGSRILGLANAYWALRHERPYRAGVYSQHEALDILSEEAGLKWDPMLVELLEQIISLANW